MSRPPFIQHWKAIVEPDNMHYRESDELLTIRSPLGRATGLTCIGIHHDLLPPGRRTSWPHAERDEEEFVYVVEGCPDVWIDGHLHRLVPGDAVGFPAGTGIAHTFINNTTTDVRLLVVGEANKSGARIHYPLHPERNARVEDRHWKDAPTRDLGGHDGLPDMLREGRTATSRSVLPQLETKRLVLRQVTLQDAEADYEMRSHPEHTKYMLHDSPQSIDESSQRIERIIRARTRGESMGWSILLRGESQVRGQAGLTSIDRANRCASLFGELRRQDWGSGLMREAVERIVSHGFDVLDFHRIQAEVDPRNERSRRGLEALGFQLEGILRGDSYYNGVFVDSAIYAKVNARS